MVYRLIFVDKMYLAGILPFRILGTATEPVFYASDIAKMLGLKRVNSAVRRLTTEDILQDNDRARLGIVTYRLYKNVPPVRDPQMTLLTLTGVKRLICNSRSIHASELAKLFDIDVYTRFEPVEIETIKQITRVFKHNYSLQYPVNGYKIDLYYPEYKLAIECDEEGHRGRNPEYEVTRQKFIESELRCVFIRYDPGAADFNILDVISRIHHHILS